MPSTSRRIKGRDRLVLLPTGSEVTAQTGTATYVAVPVATQLAIITQPAGAVDATAFTTQPVIELRSPTNQPVLQAGVTITASLVAGAGSIVGSASAVTASNGRATFANLAIDASAPPASFTVRFSASGLTSVDSSSLTVLAASTLLTASGRVLVAGGVPFPVIGDAAWSGIVQIPQADMDLYLTDRAGRGFNAVIVELVEHRYCDTAPNTIDGIAPFSGAAFTSTPNEAYMARAAYFINKAASLGMQCFVAPAYSGFQGNNSGWWAEVQAAGAAAMQNWGVYLANRFLAYNNIVWVHGGDFAPTLTGGTPALLRAVALGIRSVTTKWLHTYHTARSNSPVTYWGTGESWLPLDNVYTDFTDIKALATASYNRTPVYPFVQFEARYENEDGGATSEQQVRYQAWQALMAGACGVFMGNNPIWLFGANVDGIPVTTNWKGSQGLTSPASTHFAPALSTLLATYPAWTTSVPDFSHTVLTAGQQSGADEALARRASDGSFVIAYMPTTRQITIAMTQLSPASVRARWLDPTNGAFTTVSGSPFPNTGTRNFTPAGANSTASGDWALVLDAEPAVGNDDGAFIHTKETVDANTILAEDFEPGYGRRTLGSWFKDTTDWVTNAGTLNGTNNANWHGTIYCGVGIDQKAAEPQWTKLITPAYGVRGDSQGPIPGKVWCGTTGQIPQDLNGTSPNFKDPEVGLMAEHALKIRATEFWMRWYWRFSSDWRFGSGSKLLTLNNNPRDGGIYWGSLGTGTEGPPFSGASAALVMGLNHAGHNSGWAPNPDLCVPNLIGGTPWNAAACQAGHSYYVEVHCKLNTQGSSNGVFELWLNDGGTNRDWSGQTPTKVMSWTAVNWGASSSERFGDVWFEQYDHLGTGYQGERRIDAIIAQNGPRSGPIGFADFSRWT